MKLRRSMSDAIPANSAVHATMSRYLKPMLGSAPTHSANGWVHVRSCLLSSALGNATQRHLCEVSLASATGLEGSLCLRKGMSIGEE